MTVMQTKKCGKCGEEKDFYSYYSDKSKSDGLQSYCKECHAKRSREYRKENKEKMAAKFKKYYAANKEKLNAQAKKWKEANKEKNSDYQRKYYEANKEKMDASHKKWREDNKERHAALQKKWYEDNKKEIIAKANVYAKKRYANDPKYAFMHAIRRRLRKALGSGSGSGVRDLGCSVDWVMEYLESQFEDGWTWENRGKVWEVDHMFPLDAVDHTDRAQVKAVCNWRNLQPLSIRKNREKSNKIYPEHQRLFDDLVARFRVKLSLSEATA